MRLARKINNPESAAVDEIQVRGVRADVALTEVVRLCGSLDRIIKLKGGSSDAERQRAVVVLMTMTEFLQRVWTTGIEQSAVVQYLTDLFIAIETDTEHPALVRGRHRGGQADPYSIWRARQYVCLAAECLRKGEGRSRAMAARVIATRLGSKIQKLTTRAGKKSASDSIAHWCSSISQDAPEIVAKTYQARLLELTDQCGADAAKWTAASSRMLKIAKDIIEPRR